MTVSATSTRRATMAGAIALSAWFGSAFYCVVSGQFVVGAADVPWLLLAHLTVPPIGFAVAYRGSAAFRAVAHRLDPRLLTSFQAFRAVGLGFVALGHIGALSTEFAMTAGWGDLIAAVLAPFVALALNRRDPPRRLIVAYNLFGMIDFAAAVASNLLTSNTALGVLRSGADSHLMAVYPLGIVPSFFVGALFLCHLLCVARVVGGWTPYAPRNGSGS